MDAYPRKLFAITLVVYLGLFIQIGCRNGRKASQERNPLRSKNQKALSTKLPKPELQRDSPSPCAEPEVYYSPEDNLEQIDSDLLAHAQHDIDISAYSFTDPEIAEVLEKKANEGIIIRIYSDHSSVLSEMVRARGKEALITRLSRVPNIELRVKRSSQLAHMKSYEIDGMLLRTGSANFSRGAEERQDNDLLIIRNPASVAAFHLKFEAMWARLDNERIH